MERKVTSFELCDKDFWNNLELLRNTLLIVSEKNEYDILDVKVQSQESAAESDKQKKKTDGYSKQHILDKINEVFENFIYCQKNKTAPTLEIPNRKLWENTNFQESRGIQFVKNPVLKTVGKSAAGVSSRRLVLLQHLLTKIYKLIETNSYKTKRELYYEDVALYKSQAVVDSILDDIACLLNVSKIHLHVLTTSKGCLAGKLRFKDADGNYIDCSETARGVLVPSNVQGISNIQSNARFILVIEKSAAFEMLVDNSILTLLHPCILVTGKGFPDVNTREILKKLWDSLQIPILGLFDADPYGIEILGTYKYGSKAMAFDVKHLAVPEMRWLGILPTDIQRLHLPASSTVPLTPNDVKKARQILELPYVRHHKQWLNEVQLMLRTERKAEIEGLTKVDPLFLPSIYLPNKIKYGGWI